MARTVGLEDHVALWQAVYDLLAGKDQCVAELPDMLPEYLVAERGRQRGAAPSV